MQIGNKNITALEFTSEISDLIRAGRSGSLIEYTKATRVEPITLIDQRAVNLPYIDDVLSAGLNIFCGYYLQAVALSVNIGNVNVLKLLDKLNPNRDPIESAASGRWAEMAAGSLEGFGSSLPFSDDEADPYSQEATTNVNAKDAGNIKLLNENANLSIGKLIDVNVESDGAKASFPVNVRLMSNIISPETLVNIMSLGAADKSFKERYHKWRSGQIHFIRDLIMCQDLIDAHKKALMKDKSGQYKSRMKSRSKNKLSAILSGNPSVATASSIFVITEETAKELESAIRGKLKKFATREKLFNDTSAMMMFVIDEEWEQVTIYHRSIESATTVSVKELQRKGNGKGPDILDVLTAFQKSTSPTL